MFGESPPAGDRRRWHLLLHRRDAARAKGAAASRPCKVGFRRRRRRPVRRHLRPSPRALRRQLPHRQVHRRRLRAIAAIASFRRRRHRLPSISRHARRQSRGRSAIRCPIPLEAKRAADCRASRRCRNRRRRRRLLRPRALHRHRLCPFSVRARRRLRRAFPRLHPAPARLLPTRKHASRDKAVDRREASRRRRKVTRSRTRKATRSRRRSNAASECSVARGDQSQRSSRTCTSPFTTRVGNVSVGS